MNYKSVIKLSALIGIVTTAVELKGKERMKAKVLERLDECQVTKMEICESVAASIIEMNSDVDPTFIRGMVIRQYESLRDYFGKSKRFNEMLPGVFSGTKFLITKSVADIHIIQVQAECYVQALLSVVCDRAVKEAIADHNGDFYREKVNWRNVLKEEDGSIESMTKNLYRIKTMRVVH